jgi:hypothetical protein
MEELQALLVKIVTCIMRLLTARVSHHRARHDLPRRSGWRSRAFGTLIDGEVVAIGPDSRISFNALQHSRTRAHLEFYVFVALIHRRRSVQGLQLEKRPVLLTDALGKVEYLVLRSTPFDAKPADLPRAAKELQSRMPPVKSSFQRFHNCHASCAVINICHPRLFSRAANMCFGIAENQGAISYSYLTYFSITKGNM